MKFKKSIIWAISSVLLLVSAISAEEIKGDIDAGKTASNRRLAKFADAGPSLTFFNVNSWKIQMGHEGFFDWGATSHGSAGNYPKGMGSVIFAEGILWGAKVTDEYGVDSDGTLLTDGTGGGTPRIRVNGSMYNTGLKAGKVLRDATGKILTTGYSEDWRAQQIWRVRRDWNTADLRGDIAIVKNATAATLTDAQIAAGKAQYEHDWNDWPADEGAPFDDVNGDGVYTAGTWDAANKVWVGDVPGIPGADQTVWTVANDLPDEYTDTGIPVSVSEGGWGSPPIGFEIQITLWGYDFPFSNPLASMMFKRARINYVGLPGGPADATLDTLYFTQWSDPDLGTYTDDFVGCDTTLSLGYVYNGNKFDDQFYSSWGSAVPAAGYDFLEGPKVDANGDGVLDTLGMTSFVYFAAGSSVSDPSTKVYAGTLQWFNLMEGYLPRPEYPTQEPFVDPVTGLSETYVMAGDPVKGTGWIDGMILPPGDRRLVMNTGPFSMAVGDTQDVVIGLIGGMGEDALSSVTVMKYHDTYAQFAYNNNFVLPTPPRSPVASAFEGDGYVTLQWDKDYQLIENAVVEGFAFEGYKIYQLPSADATPDQGLVIATFDVKNLVRVISGKKVDLGSGLLLEVPEHYGSDTGIRRDLTITKDYLKDRPITNDRPFYYGISSYSYNKALAADPSSPFISLESSMTVVTVVPKKPDPGISYDVLSGESLTVSHTSGSAIASANATVVSPSDLTGNEYEVFFNNQHYYRDVDGRWKETAFPDAVGKVRFKGSSAFDCSKSTITGSALASAIVGTVDLTFSFDMDCGNNWVDGIVLDLPDDLTVNSFGTPVTGTSGNTANNLGTLDATTNTITWGNDLRSEWGAITGDVIWSVNVSLPASYPLAIAYTVYDDGYDGTIVDATGDISITELGYAYETIKHWNVKNKTTGAVVIEDQYVLDGVAVKHVTHDGKLKSAGDDKGDYLSSAEGFRVTVSGGYAAPSDFNQYTHTRPDNSTDVFSPGRATAWLNYDQHGKPFIVTSYGMQGWAASAKAIHAYGDGYADVDHLQKDYRMVWDGVLSEPDATTGYVSVVSGGSQVWLYGARGYSIADHPDPGNPGTGDPFLVTVPFKVYNMEPEGGGDPVQVSIIIYDRMANPTVTPFYAFNPANRMYTHFVLRPYEETLADFSSNEAFLTWNLVWWNAAHTVGDIIDFVYANPLQVDGDVFAFSTPSPTESAITDDDIAKINVFPNPYMGYHDLEGTDSVLPLPKYITFNHLPASGKVEFRVFNIGGTQVASFEKNTSTQYQTWNMRNPNDYPLASGVYIVHINMPDIKKERILKLAIVTEEEFAKAY